MLSESIKALIRDEQGRPASFIKDVELDPYLAKLDAHAEILSESLNGQCRGFVAFYCNDLTTKQAFITLVLVDPQDRGQGIGRALVEHVLTIARRRGFTSCRLEVNRQNQIAHDLYRSQGFRLVEERPQTVLLEIDL